MIFSCQIGGDPDKEAFLARDLSEALSGLQIDGKILSVTPFVISHAWSFCRQKYVSTQAFMIIAEKDFRITGDVKDVGEENEEENRTAD